MDKLLGLICIMGALAYFIPSNWLSSWNKVIAFLLIVFFLYIFGGNDKKKKEKEEDWSTRHLILAMFLLGGNEYAAYFIAQLGRKNDVKKFV